MGRTLPSITMQVQLEEESWSAFRRTLRLEERDVFDALWRAAKQQVAASAMARRALPFEAAVMAMLLELAKQTVVLEQQVKKQALENEKRARLTRAGCV